MRGAVWSAILVGVAGCAGWSRSVALATYESELLACVDRSETGPESKKCREGVRAKWLGRDGGHD